jgi:phage FluMu protein Com
MVARPTPMEKSSRGHTACKVSPFEQAAREEDLREYRCMGCGKVLGETDGLTYRKRCHSCKAWNYFKTIISVDNPKT